MGKSRLSAAVAFALASAAVVTHPVPPKRARTSKNCKNQGHRLPDLPVDVEGPPGRLRDQGEKSSNPVSRPSPITSNKPPYNSFGGVSLPPAAPSSPNPPSACAAWGFRAYPGSAERQAGSGFPTMGGTSINLNTIPMAAVERVEVNLDGGSAIYGSDAIGGVINACSKRATKGWTSRAHRLPDRRRAATRSSGSIVGVNGEKGSLMAVHEHDKKDVIYSRDRDYLAKQGNDSPAPTAATWEGITGLDANGDPIWKYGPWPAPPMPTAHARSPSSVSGTAATSTTARSRHHRLPQP